MHWSLKAAVHLSKVGPWMMAAHGQGTTVGTTMVSSRLVPCWCMVGRWSLLSCLLVLNLQVFLHPDGDTRDIEGGMLSPLIYISREKRPGHDHNKKAGAMNALLRASALISNGSFLLNLDCDHYVNNSQAIRDVSLCNVSSLVALQALIVFVCIYRLCVSFSTPWRDTRLDSFSFLKDLMALTKTIVMPTETLCSLTSIWRALMDNRDLFTWEPGASFVAGYNHLGLSIALLCPWTNSLCLAVQTLYGFLPPSNPSKKGIAKPKSSSQFFKLFRKPSLRITPAGDDEGMSRCGNFCSTPILFFLSDAGVRLVPAPKLPARLGACTRFTDSATADSPGVDIEDQPVSPRSMLSDVVLAISCDYETNTDWGREAGWMYGSVTEDILTGMKIHTRGWRSAYCDPDRAAFKGSAPLNMTDRLQQVERWATGAVEIFFSGWNPLWSNWGTRLRIRQRLA